MLACFVIVGNRLVLYLFIQKKPSSGIIAENKPNSEYRLDLGLPLLAIFGEKRKQS